MAYAILLSFNDQIFMEKYSNIFVVSGPSGAGEDSVIEGLGQVLPIERIITTTTRLPREGDRDDSYYFVSREDFEKGIVLGRFVEYAKQYNGNFYGVTQDELDRVELSGKIGIWKIEYQGVINMKRKFSSLRAILITVTSLDILEQRIRRRNKELASEEYIRERMEYTKEWLKHTDIYDKVVINHEGKLIETIQEVAEYIRSNMA